MSGQRQACTGANTVPGSLNLCTGEIEYTNYNYNPTLWVCALFVSLFGFTTLLHLIQTLKSKKWFALPTIVTCAAVETLGWSGRLWSAKALTWDPSEGGFWATPGTAFLMQISTLIIAPAFLSAYWYILFGRLISVIGPQYCRFTIRLYVVVFVLGDVGSLVIQAIGGGMASAALTSQGANNGAHVMVAGVIFQMIIMIIYSLLLAEFIFRYFSRRPVNQFRLWRGRSSKPLVPVLPATISKPVEKKSHILIGAMVFSTLLIFIRSVYRTIELLNGWTGPIISNQVLFDVLDGVMVFLALLTFNVINPMWYLPHPYELEQQYTDDKPVSSEEIHM